MWNPAASRYFHAVDRIPLSVRRWTGMMAAAFPAERRQVEPRTFVDRFRFASGLV